MGALVLHRDVGAGLAQLGRDQLGGTGLARRGGAALDGGQAFDAITELGLVEQGQCGL